MVDLEDDHSPGAFAAALPSAFAIVGQPDLPAEVLHEAAALRAIVNVEGNFFPNVDYPTAFARGIRVLGCGSAYSQAVAEYALGLALDLARGISREDRAMRRNGEAYTADSNLDAILLRKADGRLRRIRQPGPRRPAAAGPVRADDPGVRSLAARRRPRRRGRHPLDAGRHPHR